MRTFKIHYTVNESDDDFTISGDSLEELTEKANSFFTNRGLKAEDCNAWSEEL